MRLLSRLLSYLKWKNSPWQPPILPEEATPEERQAIELGRLLDELRRQDRFCRVFGANRHCYRMKPSMTETELLTWEEQAGVTVPLDYRAFLKIAGRGGAGPDYGLFALPDPSPDLPLAEPFPYIAEVNVAASLGDPAFEAFHTEERGCLTLSHGGCGYYSFLIITGAARGQVWADGRVTDQGMKPIFNRFTDWYEDWLRRSIGECRTQGGSHG